MPSNAITIYCGNSFSREAEAELKSRARDIAYVLSRGRNQLGQGSYGRSLGRPPGVSMGEALLSTLRGRPDAMEAIFAAAPEAFVDVIALFMANPRLRAAILSGVANASGQASAPEPQIVAQELAVTPIEVDLTDDILAELSEREAGAELRLRSIKIE